ncbi:ABC transporter ATP-binding protein [Microbacterium sp.]|uniref:ABC transporter ATP-binding protein n=1 Tax=Microbacterium sp. TaxID=51671 RepID=UPI0025D0CEBB|nr:ABC transporter ATP-binding protein [Microbacterium sp.]MBT9605384.1 ABC transporter ATP-binding protein [Microbacterium sp.]
MTLQVRAVSGGYGSRSVVEDVDLDVGGGEIVSVLGPSGSGKTTLLRMIAGLHPLSSGTIALDGRDVTGVPTHRRGVGLVPQEGALFPRRTVAGNIAYGLSGVSPRRAAQHPEVRRLLDLVQLSGFADRLPHELSGGQRQRVAVARALAARPAVVLLDEPFNALDAALRADVRTGVCALLREVGVATVLITHDRAEAFLAGDRVAVFQRGSVAQIDAPGEVYRHPRSLEIARLTGEVVAVPSALRGDGEDEAFVRPSQISLDATAPVRGIVTAVVDEGARVIVSVQLAGGDVLDVGCSPFASDAQIGAEVGLRVEGRTHPAPTR